ncbi:hypothetical protein F5Y14DRAFT_92894 [Nemania sp. NC0429]|nr:hypothetical protein F5Y14DRAFT_92894 [Nemania sp. NC0429]
MPQQSISSVPLGNLEEEMGHKLLNTAITFTILITVVFFLFLWSRLLHSERNTWEIWVLYPASYLACLALCISCIVIVPIGGAGRHIAYLATNEPAKIVTFLKIQAADEIIYVLSVTLPKISILSLYLRIFPSRNIRIVTCVVMALVIANFFASGLITGLTICHPFAFKWDKTIPGGWCADFVAAYKYASVPNIIFDLVIAVLPLSTIYHLQVSKIRKLGIFITFLAGSLGIITAIIRFVGFFSTDFAQDFTYFGIKMFIYTIVEPCAYFICSCLPGMRPLLRTVYTRSGLRSKFHPTTDKHSDSSGWLSLGKIKGIHRTLVSAPSEFHSELQAQDTHNDRAGFIRLDRQ